MKIRNVMLAIVVACSLPGCAALDHMFCAPECRSETRNTSSLVEFLYPNGAEPPAANSIPQLHVPLRIGLAFLPSRGGPPDALPAARRQELLEKIRARFTDRKFIGEIVMIPDYYLANARGFAGLEGVQRLYQVDLMGLVSYDQVTHLDDNSLSLGYLTIVGAYVLRGSSHDTTTLVDLAVVDPATRSLVLRAGGTDSRHANSTAIDQERDARGAGLDSFAAATEQMIGNFDTALTAFEADVRAGKANVRVVRRDASSRASGGGGALHIYVLLALASLLVLRRARDRASDARR